MSVAVVTGASSGLGRVIARSLLDAGWQVALAGRRSELLSETADGAPDGDTGVAGPRDFVKLRASESRFIAAQ